MPITTYDEILDLEPSPEELANEEVPELLPSWAWLDFDDDDFMV